MFQWNFVWGRDTDPWDLSISAVIDCLGNWRPPSFLWPYKLPRTLSWGSDLIWVGRENGFALLNRIIAISKTERQKPEAEPRGNKLKMKPLLNFHVSFLSLSPLQRSGDSCLWTRPPVWVLGTVSALPFQPRNALWSRHKDLERRKGSLLQDIARLHRW